MKKIGMAIHAGAGPDSEFVRKNLAKYEQGLEDALRAGYQLLKKGGAALDAVEKAVRTMEDNPIFNAGRGSSLNCFGEVRMHAAIMDGKTLGSGAGCLLSQIRNPITFARTQLEDGENVFLGGRSTLETARAMNIDIEPPSYFITDLQVEEYLKHRKKCLDAGLKYNPASHGTVGAVARDKKGNVASGTSTGGTHFGDAGRIGDTSMIGVGTYANNEACAVSCTGDGEALIKAVLAHSIFALRRYTPASLQEAVNHCIRKKKKDSDPDMGAISIDPAGNIAIQFNSERMHRAWVSGSEKIQVRIYRQ
jgi:beta-aspartyl-peptidase (threonine type)